MGRARNGRGMDFLLDKLRLAMGSHARPWLLQAGAVVRSPGTARLQLDQLININLDQMDERCSRSSDAYKQNFANYLGPGIALALDSTGRSCSNFLSTSASSVSHFRRRLAPHLTSTPSLLLFLYQHTLLQPSSTMPDTDLF